MNEITKVIFEAGKNKAEASEPIWQWSYGQILHIEGLTLPHEVEIQFSLQKIGGIAERQIGITKDGITEVSIPNKMLENRTCQSDEYTIYAWIYLSDERSGQTEYEITIPCKVRSRPGDYAPKNEPNFAGKVIDELNKLGSEKLTKPQTAKVGQIFRVQEVNEDGTLTLEAVDMPECDVTDVTVNGTSIVGEDGVAEIPQAEGNSDVGLIGVLNSLGFGILKINNKSFINAVDIANAQIDDRYSTQARLLKLSNLDYAVQAAMGAPIGDGMIDGVFHYPAWSEETQKAAIERIGLKDYAKYKYFNFIEAGVNVEGNPTYDEIKEAVLSDVTPVLIHGHYIAYMTSGHWDAEAFEREELPGFTFVTHRSDMNNHWKIKYTEFWCTKQDDGSTLWAVGEHYYIEDFVAEYGTTTYEELLNAFKSNKQLILHVPAGKTSGKQPEMYASLVRLDGGGNNRNFAFVCLENNVEHHFVMEHDRGKWLYYDITLADNNVLNSKIAGLTNSVGNIRNYINGKDPMLSALSSMNAVDILKSVYNFRGGFCDNAGTLHIKNPGIYLIMQGGTGNKQITIKQPGTTALEAKWNGVIVLAYEGGVVTPIGIESSLTIAGAFKTPGTFQGWTTDGSYSTTINYPAQCVVSYLGNGDVNYLE